MKTLECECGNDVEFYQITTVFFDVNSRGEKEKKLSEDVEYFCDKCDKKVFLGD